MASTAYAKYSGLGGGGAAPATGDLTDVGTDGITITGGTGAVNGAGTQIAQHVADATHNGYLSLTDWNTFNSKQAAGNYITALTGDGTAAGPGSAALTLATVNSNVGSFGGATSVSAITVNAKGLVTAAASTAIQIAESQVTNLVSDLAGKQPTGNYITALTGDATASGPGSAALTLATVNSNVGSFGNATSVTTLTVNAKGLVTAAATLAIQTASGSQPGLLSAADWTTFNGKVGFTSPTTDSTFGNVTANGSMTGIANIGIGARCVDSVTGGVFNLGIGTDCLTAVTGGNANVAIGVGAGNNLTGSNNTYLGTISGQANTTGSGNVGIGYSTQAGSTGSNNFVMGSFSGATLLSGSGNILIGTGVEPFTASTSGEGTIGSNTAAITRFNFGRNQSYGGTPAGTTTWTAGGDASGSDVSAASRTLVIGGAAGTGTGAGGILALATAPAGSSGSTNNAYVNRLTIASNGDVAVTKLTTAGPVITSASGVLSSEAQLANSRGGTGLDSSASTGLAKVASGTWSVATLVNADVSSSAAIAATKLAPFAPLTITGATTLGASDQDVFATNSSAYAVTLPTAVGIAGKIYNIAAIGTSITNFISINTTSSQTISGRASGNVKLRRTGDFVQVVSDGTNWQIRAIQETIIAVFKSTAGNNITSSFADVAFATAVEDSTNSNFSGTVFTADVPGMYEVGYEFRVPTPGASAIVSSQTLFNASVVGTGGYSAQATGEAANVVGLPIPIRLNGSSDTIKVQAKNTGGTTAYDNAAGTMVITIKRVGN